MKQTVQPIDYQ